MKSSNRTFCFLFVSEICKKKKKSSGPGSAHHMHPVLIYSKVTWLLVGFFFISCLIHDIQPNFQGETLLRTLHTNKSIVTTTYFEEHLSQHGMFIYFLLPFQICNFLLPVICVCLFAWERGLPQKFVLFFSYFLTLCVFWSVITDLVLYAPGCLACRLLRPARTRRCRLIPQRMWQHWLWTRRRMVERSSPSNTRTLSQKHPVML